MKFGFFPVMAGRRAGGPETYELSLLPELARAAPEDQFFLYCLSDAAVDAFSGLPDNVSTQRLVPRARWLSIPFSLPLALHRDDVDLLHVTFTPPPYSPATYVFTMHDISMFERPEFYPPAVRFRLTRLIERGLAKARVILCVSEHCSQSVAERFGISEERLVVAHHGVAPKFRPIDREEATSRVRARFGVEPPFFLHVGKYEKRKNLTRLLEAFAAFRNDRGEAPSLVLAGKPDWLGEEIAAVITRLGLGRSVIEIGYVGDEDLPYLHNAAEMLVFPSLWEGFGLPILEAMACGLPVVTSNVTCIPEVAGDAASLVDPLRVDEIADAMGQLHDDAARRAALRARGLERARRFTWQRCAQATLTGYRRALEMSRA